MQPYYEDPHTQLYVGDCRDVLPALELQADCVIADPPYGETSLAWDRWPDGWLEVAAIVAPALWCFGSMRMFLKHHSEYTAAGWKLAQDVVWEKHNGPGFQTDRFRRVHEIATHWYRGAWGDVHHEVPRIISGEHRRTIRRSEYGPAQYGSRGPSADVRDGTVLARSVLYAKSMQRSAIHPTEKPVKGLLEHLVSYSVPPGGLVVDPFAGSGSTLVAAREMGRQAVGVEASEEYCEAAAKRLSAIDAQPHLPFEVGA
ncbi:DNA-methyltransferase [Nocardiopsis changdeensis]|uniref:Methyltransferase n=1 Tax=Nocardiopsis changdeensis TaxID=2831969 RepID=A0ABX8BG79_9ACTN|nr:MULTISPECIES: site-specific DNA-methyltransferase [Nocardiopsis]QUX20354.1 site-specific DNA-methyltransferase [Nocardiopsis changdeensis]QYX36284.1 site-specific DNA-methyltransferase [Nocardiopsis sp. MT53]